MFERRDPGVSRLGAGFRQAGAVPARPRHLLGPAEGEPYVACRQTRCEGVGRRPVAEFRQHRLADDDAPIRLAEDLGDGAVELADLQRLSRERISG